MNTRPANNRERKTGSRGKTAKHSFHSIDSQDGGHLIFNAKQWS